MQRTRIRRVKMAPGLRRGDGHICSNVPTQTGPMRTSRTGPVLHGLALPPVLAPPLNADARTGQCLP